MADFEFKNSGFRPPLKTVTGTSWLGSDLEQSCRIIHTQGTRKKETHPETLWLQRDHLIPSKDGALASEATKQLSVPLSLWLLIVRVWEKIKLRGTETGPFPHFQLSKPSRGGPFSTDTNAN